MTTEIVKRSTLFIEFLQERKIYRQFKDNLIKYNEKGAKEVNSFLSGLEENDEMIIAVGNAFLWTDSEEGFSFWNNVDTDWQRKLHRARRG